MNHYLKFQANLNIPLTKFQSKPWLLSPPKILFDSSVSKSFYFIKNFLELGKSFYAPLVLNSKTNWNSPNSDASFLFKSARTKVSWKIEKRSIRVFQKNFLSKIHSRIDLEVFLPNVYSRIKFEVWVKDMKGTRVNVNQKYLLYFMREKLMKLYLFFQPGYSFYMYFRPS